MINRNLCICILLIWIAPGCHLVQPLFSKPPKTDSESPKQSPPAHTTQTNQKKSVPVVSSKNTVKNAATIGKISGATANHISEKGFTPSSELFQLQNPPEWLQVKYGILLNSVAEKLTNLALLQVMDKWWGTRYCLGGSTENCIDCSAFTQLISREVYGLALPRTAQEQFDACEIIERDELKEGDLVFFHTRGKKSAITHVGVFLLNNKFVHASTSNGVSISDLDESYWKPKFRGGGRMVTQ
jgi:lipoprotein Spr